MRKMFIRETALVLAAAVLAAGTLASCRTDVSDGDIPYSPYLKIEKRNGVYVGGEYKDGVCVVYGIYGESIPADGKIVIPDGVELGWTWRNVYDKSDKWLRTLELSDIKSISIPAGADSMTFQNITYLAGWPSSGEADIDVIYRGSLADWCENGYLNWLYSAKSIKIGNGKTDLKTLEKITEADIAGAKRIGELAFSGCSGLKEIAIPDSVTEIGYDAFYGCTGLTTVTIGKGVTKIGDYAFYNCSNLKEIAIPDSVTEIGKYAFSSCKELATVTIGKGVTKIGDDAFYYCSNLKEIAIPDSVTEIGKWAFSGCSGLTTVTIGKGVTKIGDYAFYECEKLKEIAIPDSVTEIGGDAFSGCSGLTTVTIGKGVTKIGDYAFYKCSNLKEIAIPDSVTEIGKYAFYSCNALNSVTFAETDGWYSVDSDGKKESVDFSKPAENGNTLKNAYDTYFVRETK